MSAIYRFALSYLVDHETKRTQFQEKLPSLNLHGKHTFAPTHIHHTCIHKQTTLIPLPSTAATLFVHNHVIAKGGMLSFHG